MEIQGEMNEREEEPRQTPAPPGPPLSPYVITLLLGAGVMFLVGIIWTLIEIAGYRG